MPSVYMGVRYVVRYCRRFFTWSTSRGGCRFAPGHDGPCKPGRYAR